VLIIKEQEVPHTRQITQEPEVLHILRTIKEQEQAPIQQTEHKILPESLHKIIWANILE